VTFTTVPSMKTRLDASMVAARIHRSEPGAQGALARVERAMASSQGVRMEVLNAGLFYFV
jgi:hypothetical protein